MGTKETKIFTRIVGEIQSNPAIMRYARPGWCRMWSALAKDLITVASLPDCNATIQALETDVLPGFSHTFLKVTINNTESYIMDGTGVEDHPPFFGPVQETPDHLKNSRVDIMLNSY